MKPRTPMGLVPATIKYHYLLPTIALMSPICRTMIPLRLCSIPNLTSCSGFVCNYATFPSRAHSFCGLYINVPRAAVSITSCSSLLYRGLLRSTPLSLRLGTWRSVFYRNTPCCELLPEPLATLLFGPPRMAKLPFDYLSQHSARPLTIFVRAENA
jgi:hypothetical protein